MATLLFDIGNVLWSDEAGDALTLANIGAVLRERGRLVTEEEIAAAQARAVADFAPSPWRTVIATLCGGDAVLAAEVTREVRARWDALSDAEYAGFTTPFASTAPLLGALAAAGHRMVLARDNSPRALLRLEALDLLRHFAVKEVSETLHLAKPDLRFYLALLAAAGAAPADCLMVGDRIDNDILPARRLGLRTLRLRHGSHAAQEPRSPAEAPELTVDHPDQLATGIARLLASSDV
ncbi:HAD family hydrolase [bacterium]|nr:HAD family hydrolase [bacterium]